MPYGKYSCHPSSKGARSSLCSLRYSATSSPRPSICRFTVRKRTYVRQMDLSFRVRRWSAGQSGSHVSFCGGSMNICSVWRRTALTRTRMKRSCGWLARKAADPAGSIMSGCSLPGNFCKAIRSLFTGMVRHAPRKICGNSWASATISGPLPAMPMPLTIPLRRNRMERFLFRTAFPTRDAAGCMRWK